MVSCTTLARLPQVRVLKLDTELKTLRKPNDLSLLLERSLSSNEVVVDHTSRDSGVVDAELLGGSWVVISGPLNPKP